MTIPPQQYWDVTVLDVAQPSNALCPLSAAPALSCATISLNLSWDDARVLANGTIETPTPPQVVHSVNEVVIDNATGNALSLKTLSVNPRK